jgi:thioester reductase-like protein
MNGDVLITGATGFVGMELLARYLERTDRRVVALIRAADDEGARARLRAVLVNLFGERQAARYTRRADAVAGELTAPGLGCARRTELAERVTTIVHSAASISFTLPLEEARAINLDGTRRMLEFAQLAGERGDGLDVYGHVSTTYVAGGHSGRFAETDLDRGQSFHNSYERSKFEAEQLVRSSDGVPFTIMRPSIVVGDRQSGWTSAFNVLYWPLRAFSRGLFTTVPAVPTAPVDVVSIDYVADGIYELCSGPGARETYHLCAGKDASTIGEIAQLASRYFRRPVPEFLSLSRRGTSGGQGFEHGSEYFPYFAIRALFDDARTRARLEPAGLTVTPLHDYLDRLLDFATRSRWGKRPIARAEALAT